MHASALTQADITQARATKFVADVYVRMILALITSSVIGYVSIQSGFLLSSLETMGRGLTLAIFGTQLLTVIAFQGSIFSMKPALARALFAVYAVITGLTLGLVGLIYTLDSILMVTMLSSAAFAGLAIYGKTTQRDLGPIGAFALSALMMLMVFGLGLLLTSFVPALQPFMDAAMKLHAVIGTVIFSAMIAYESQKLKAIARQLAQQTAHDDEIEVFVNSAALSMYMNFIGLFLSLMRLLGSRR
ncbi:MAG TPA: Bax inhibitor-1 family protein [Oligoflexus sp.]|uniref:Bax inhibitor-1/YccA family protein n=1 Tax=Oligoflexus sp. TaxID=1971216 RepID=UPI002D2FDEF7|nr:Bax inhibitor-1 family protein [Oligoflexus sp.]HYX37354.1 Bax inhibitor-1 family protein [Oligoflexus sp.]